MGRWEGELASDFHNKTFQGDTRLGVAGFGAISAILGAIGF
jgi:hypothetical protein